MGLSAGPALAVGEGRTALVVGNAGYGGDTSLRNPVNDARDMAEVLRVVGFEVTQKENLDERGFDATVSGFARQLQQRGGVPVGLHDTIGNAWEWTCSEWDEKYSGTETQCSNNNTTGLLAVRGGSWFYIPVWVRSANRDGGSPTDRDLGRGFHLARSL